MPAMEVEAAVDRGAALLDIEIPGWFHKIDLDTLCLEDVQRCVLGQLFPEKQEISRQSWYESIYSDGRVPTVTEDSMICVANYNVGVVLLGLTYEDACKHGFNVHHDALGATTFGELDEAWTKVIRARQEGAKEVTA